MFAPLKAAHRDQVEILERDDMNIIGKQHFTSLYSPARERAFTPKNIKAGFAASGLFPFNPDRVLRGIPKPAPPPELTIPKGDEGPVEPYSQDEVLQTPVTPVSGEALISLQNLIIKRHANPQNEMSKQSLYRHVQKITNAARKSLAKSVIQKDQIRFLIKINNEAKVRRSTKSVVLGKAKVMSYEDLEEARVKRAEKDVARETKSKGKRGRKPKSVATEAETSNSDNGGRGRKRKKSALEVDAAEQRAKVARTSEVRIAPVARRI